MKHLNFSQPLLHYIIMIVPMVKYYPGRFEAHHTCWRTGYPSNILLTSTAGLANNIVYQQPINFLPDSSWKLKIEYSIIVQQQSIDSNAYGFFHFCIIITI